MVFKTPYESSFRTEEEKSDETASTNKASVSELCFCSTTNHTCSDCKRPCCNFCCKDPEELTRRCKECQKELSSLETKHPCMPGQAREERQGGARQDPLDNIQGLENMSMSALKDILRNKKLPLSGNKATLVQRLQSDQTIPGSRAKKASKRPPKLLPNSEKSQKYNLEAISNEVDCSKTKKLYLNPPKTQKNVKMTAGRQAPAHDWLTSDWLGEDLEEDSPPTPRRPCPSLSSNSSTSSSPHLPPSPLAPEDNQPFLSPCPSLTPPHPSFSPLSPITLLLPRVRVTRVASGRTSTSGAPKNSRLDQTFSDRASEDNRSSTSPETMVTSRSDVENRYPSSPETLVTTEPDVEYSSPVSLETLGTTVQDVDFSSSVCLETLGTTGQDVDFSSPVCLETLGTTGQDVDNRSMEPSSLFKLTPQIMFEAKVGRLEVQNTSRNLLAYKVKVNAPGYMLQGGCAILKPGQKKSIKLVMPQSGSSDDYAEIKFFKDSLLKEKLRLKSQELSDYLKGEKHVEASTVIFGVTGVEETPTKPKKPFEPIYICEVCTKAFKYMGQLQIHRTKKHGAIEKKLPCTLCKYEGFTQKHLNRHVKREHTEKNRSSIKKIHCERCEKEFPSDVTYNIHFAANHVPTKCKVEWCGKESSNRIQDRMHRERAHSRDQGQTKHSEKKIPEPCNVCGKELKSASGMRYHILNHKVTVEPQGGDLLEIGGEETIGESVIQAVPVDTVVQYITVEEAKAAGLEVTHLLEVQEMESSE